MICKTCVGTLGFPRTLVSFLCRVQWAKCIVRYCVNFLLWKHFFQITWTLHFRASVVSTFSCAACEAGLLLMSADFFFFTKAEGHTSLKWVSIKFCSHKHFYIRFIVVIFTVRFHCREQKHIMLWKNPLRWLSIRNVLGFYSRISEWLPWRRLELLAVLSIYGHSCFYVFFFLSFGEKLELLDHQIKCSVNYINWLFQLPSKYLPGGAERYILEGR